MICDIKKMSLSDSQFITILIAIISVGVTIIGTGIGLAYRIGNRLGNIEGSVAALDGRLNRVEDDIRTVFNLFHEISRAEVGELRQDLREERSKKEGDWVELSSLTGFTYDKEELDILLGYFEQGQMSQEQAQQLQRLLLPLFMKALDAKDFDRARKIVDILISLRGIISGRITTNVNIADTIHLDERVETKKIKAGT
jgi:hypothetical protein